MEKKPPKPAITRNGHKVKIDVLAVRREIKAGIFSERDRITLDRILPGIYGDILASCARVRPAEEAQEAQSTTKGKQLTPTRLREIAERLETQCFQLQPFWCSHEARRPGACDGCKAAARELRELAETMESANVPTHQ